MKIALYQPWIYLYGGLERSLLELVQRSRHQWTIFTGHYEPENTFPEFKKLDIVELSPLSIDRNMLQVLKAGIRIFLQKIPLDDYDALVIWCDGMGDMATFRNHEKPVFNICSTPLRPVFDPVYIEQALHTRPFHSQMAFYLFKTLFAIIDRLAWKHYTGVIATSQEVKQRILTGRLYRDTDQLQLFYPGIDWKSYEPPSETPSQTLLLPGRIMWSKNISLAIHAFIKSGLPTPWNLVIAGFVDKKSQPYLKELRKLAQNCPQIIFEESPSDNRLRELYQEAALILFTPLNEDWGIVPLEAMASSKAVIANASGGPKESILHGKTGWLLEPTVDAWSEQLKKLPGLEETIKQMGKSARAHVRQYDWSEFTMGIDKVFDKWAMTH
ncbi:MAG: glycosyltransferase [Desulfocapsaceae bacterium]|nr:glycosyltransferase [Desulfocapsaceae bacterium]